MKMTKKFLLGAVAGLAAVMFTGCLPSIGIGNEIKENTNMNGDNKALATYKIDYTNESATNDRRGLKWFITDRKEIVMNLALKELVPDTANPGVLGVAFNISKNKGVDEETGEKLPNYGSYNFCLVGVRNNEGVARTYLSYFENITEELLDENNFGATTTATGYNAKETIIADFTALPDVKVTDGVLQTGIRVKLISAADVEANPSLSNGAYKVEWFNSTNYKDLAALTKANAEDAEFSSVVPKSVIGYGDEDKVDDGKMGIYVNCYKQQTIVGEWQLGDIAGNPIPFVWDDSVEANPIFAK